jgi:glucokinase
VSELALAVDIGGTKILVGLIDAQGTIVVSRQVATPAREGAEAIIAAVAGLARQVLADAPSVVSRCGVGTAGWSASRARSPRRPIT